MNFLQVKEIADKFYGTKVTMKMEKQEVVFDTVVTSYDMKFDNTIYKSAMAAQAKLKESSMPIRAAILFEMFPFCILFTVYSFKKVFLLSFLEFTFRISILCSDLNIRHFKFRKTLRLHVLVLLCVLLFL